MGTDAKQPYKYIHGVYVENRNSSAVVACLKNTETQQSELRIHKNPQRPFWITKDQFRNHHGKREFACENELDQIICSQHELPRTLAEKLSGGVEKQFVKEPDPFKASLKSDARRALRMLEDGNPKNSRFVMRKLLDNPYVYGADIDIEVIIKKTYADSCTGAPRGYTVGALDIETSVVGGNEINLISYVDPVERKVYTGILQSFLKPEHTREHLLTMYQNKAADFVKQMKPDLQKLFTRQEFKIEFFVTNNEVELITWIFDAIHKTKPDFISIWNMIFDIGYILKRLALFKVSAEKIMCHPDVPPQFRKCELIPDTKKALEHFTDRWDWFSLTGYTQFVDSMCLYSRLRKAIGRETNYTLGYIAGQLLGAGKIGFDGADHFTMQTTRFDEYVVYNIFDTILLILLEELNGDFISMVDLTAESRLCDFSRQTIRLKNTYYDYCRKNKNVPASIGKSLKHETDDRITNIGGGVLSPLLADETGVSILTEHEGIEGGRTSGMHKFVCDIDAASKLHWTLQL